MVPSRVAPFFPLAAEVPHARRAPLARYRLGMSSLLVQPVSSRREQSAFIRLPWTLYEGDPNWVPPLRLNIRELVGYKPHPFYEDAEVQTFLANREGKPCGRIAAIVNHAHNRRYDERRGFFGFFESIDDEQVAHALLDTAAGWLVERGMSVMRGPTNPSLNYECGLLIEGFDSPPFFMMTYNPRFYPRLLEGYGLEKSQDLYAYWGHVDMLGSLDKKLAFVVQSAKERFDIKVRHLNKGRFRQDVEMFLDIYNQSLAGTWGFVPLSAKEIRHISASLRFLIEPRLALAAEVEGKAVGVTFALPDYNQRIKSMDGRLFPFGFLKLLMGRRAIKRFRILAANVVPEYQRWGVGLVLLSGLVPLVREWGMEEVEFSWVLESNQLSRGSLERGGAKRTKTYRIYDRPIG